jgi:hypothetical protein
MYKTNIDITKKTIKQIAVLSAIATLMFAALGSIPATKSYALSFLPFFGSDREDRENNRNSIDADSFVDCFGVANDCDKVNRHNTDNRVFANERNSTTPTPTPGNPDFTACAECFTQSLNPTQLASVKGLAGLSIDASNDALCHVIVHAIITAPVVGVTSAVADTIIQCLIDAGFTNLA